jgi:hypothetical protein
MVILIVNYCPASLHTAFHSQAAHNGLIVIYENSSGILAGFAAALDAQAAGDCLVVIFGQPASPDFALHAQARWFGLRVKATLDATLYAKPTSDSLVVIHEYSPGILTGFDVAFYSHARLRWGILGCGCVFSSHLSLL